MNSLQKHPEHTCVDGNTPCSACMSPAVKQPVKLHPDNGYHRPTESERVIREFKRYIRKGQN